MSREQERFGRFRKEYLAFEAPAEESKSRLLARIASEPPPRSPHPLAAWAHDALGLRVRLPAAILVAAAAFCLGLVLAPRLGGRGPAPPTPGTGGAGTGPPELVEFVLLAPEARSVSVAGDFNDWNPTGLRMKRRGPAGVWIGATFVPRGPHHYMFVLDGRKWVPDPAAPLAPGDEYQSPTSVFVAGTPGAL